jgi:hypothetical protein
LGAATLIARLRTGDEGDEAACVLPVFRNPLSIPARVRAMPDLIDRTRLVSVAVLAGFALLAVALVSHLALTSAPLSLPGLSGKGQVLTVPRDSSKGPRAGHASTAPAGTAAQPAVGAAAGGAGGGGGGQAGAGSGPSGSGAPRGDQPRRVGISLGSAPTSQPGSTPQSPGSTGTGTTGGGSTPAGTGGGQENGSGTVPAGPSNDYGHSSPIPPGTPPVTGATSNGHSSGSQTSGASGYGSDSTSSASTAPTTSSPPANSSGPSGLAGKLKSHSK